MAPWLAQRYPKVDWQWQHACVVQPQQATAAGMQGYLPIVSAQVERLLHADQSVGQVSAALGFSDEPSFRRGFKAVTGVTPTAYRDLHAG